MSDKSLVWQIVYATTFSALVEDLRKADFRIWGERSQLLEDNLDAVIEEATRIADASLKGDTHG